MIREKKKTFIENYEKLYEELKIKYETKERENEQLKTLLKLRDKEIISLKKKIKSANNSTDGIYNIYNNNNIPEISQKYIEDLINTEIENIQKEQLLYRNKILTLENYELQYLAPKLTTGSNHNYQFSSSKLIKNNIETIYSNIKSEAKPKSKKQIRLSHKYSNNIENENLNASMEFRTFTSFGGEDNNYILNGSFSKTLTRSKRKFDD